MTPLIAGIFSLFSTTNDFKTAISSRMYFEEAPQNVDFPYCVVSIISSEHNWTFSDTFEDVLVQFSIFTQDSSAVNIGTYWGYLISLFDSASLTVSGYSSIFMHRGQSRLMRETEDNIWQYVVEYDCEVEKA